MNELTAVGQGAPNIPTMRSPAAGGSVIRSRAWSRSRRKRSNGVEFHRWLGFRFRWL